MCLLTLPSYCQTTAVVSFYWSLLSTSWVRQEYLTKGLLFANSKLVSVSTLQFQWNLLHYQVTLCTPPFIVYFYVWLINKFNVHHIQFIAIIWRDSYTLFYHAVSAVNRRSNVCNVENKIKQQQERGGEPEVDDEIVGVALVIEDLQQTSEPTSSTQFIKHVHELQSAQTIHSSQQHSPRQIIHNSSINQSIILVHDQKLTGSQHVYWFKKMTGKN